MIVLTHPRSVSTEFTRIVCDLTAADNLGEMFNWADKSSFGILHVVKDHFISNGRLNTAEPMEATVARIVNFEELNLARPRSQYALRKALYRPEKVLFRSIQDVINYYDTECNQRFQMLKKFDAAGIHYLVKHFFFVRPDHTRSTLEGKLSMNDKFIFIRKNITETVYSAAIKKAYYDSNPDLLTMFKDTTANKIVNPYVASLGHNMVDRPMVPLNVVKKIPTERGFVNHIVNCVLAPLEHYDPAIDNIFFSEDIADKRPIKIQAFNQQFEIDNYEFTELPMDYTSPKVDFFEDPESIIKMVNAAVRQSKYADIAASLGIK
jgi:hypothetical protein